jgi:hypothetical protein
MDERSLDARRFEARRFEVRGLIIPVTLLVGLSRLVEPPALWLVAALVLVTTAFGVLHVLADVDPAGHTSGVPVESLLIPAAAAMATVGAIRLVPVGVWILPWMAVAAFLLDRTLATEAGLVAASRGSGPETRMSVLGGALVVAFVGFLGVAAAIPGGLPDPGTSLAAPSALPLDRLAVLATADGVLAALLGYRAAALRGTRLRDVLWAAVTCGIVVAIGAAALRAMALPRLLGPALLVVVFYLWDSTHAAVRADQRDARRIWEALLLAVAAVVAIGWSLSIRG